MAILIEGMEMPRNCFGCPLFDDVYTDADGDDDYRCGLGVPLDYYQASGETEKDCPLIELPPHGDLIDRDAILKKCEFVCTDNDEDIRAVRYSIIENAPTVIPASEEG